MKIQFEDYKPYYREPRLLSKMKKGLDDIKEGRVTRWKQ